MAKYIKRDDLVSMDNLPKGISAGRLEEYAQNNGYNSVKFIGINEAKQVTIIGEFFDAYYDFVKIPRIGDGIFRLCDIERELGYDTLFFVLTEREYETYVALDFMLRGKNPPKE